MILSKVKYIINLILFVSILGLSISSNILYRKNKRLDNQIGKLNNNVLQYQSLLNNTHNDNRVLQLAINDFKNSNDSLIKELDNKRKELKLKDKELKFAMSNNLSISDTTTIEIESNKPYNIDCDFNITIKPNELTEINICRTDNTLVHTMNIETSMKLFIADKKEYRNSRKHFFDRLIHFDFKKDKVYRYNIELSNDKIKIKDIRILTLD